MPLVYPNTSYDEEAEKLIDARDAVAYDNRVSLERRAKTDLLDEYTMLKSLNDPFTRGVTQEQYIDKWLASRIKELTGV